jgi:hypothetical protein
MAKPRHSLRLAVLAAVAALALVPTSSARHVSAARCWTAVLKPGDRLLGVGGAIRDVAASSRDDAWAVGQRGVQTAPHTTRAKPLLAHWNGHAWKAARSPFRWGSADAIVVLSQREAWASMSNVRGVFLLHWNGVHWLPSKPPADVRVPALARGPRGRVWLLGGREIYERSHGRWVTLAALGPVGPFTYEASRRTDQLWRIRGFAPAHRRPPFVERWAGARWEQTPLRINRGSDLYTIVAQSNRDAWLAGTDGSHALLFRWNGRRWSRASAPPRRAIDAWLFESARGTLWLGGTKTDASESAFTPYLRRRDGSRWHVVPPPTHTDTFTLYRVGSETWATSILTEGIVRFTCP